LSLPNYIFELLNKDWRLFMGNDEIIRRFMYGHCYALAYELAPVMNYPIEMLFASRPDEGRIADPLHVYLRLNDRDIFDIKGRRSFDCMRQDFDGLLGLLRRSENDILLTETETLSDRDDRIIGASPWIHPWGLADGNCT